MNNNEWQPIDTAPKDGTFWIYGRQCKNCEPEMVIGWYNKLWKKFCYADGYGSSEIMKEPTYWMPLPKPPKQ